MLLPFNQAGGALLLHLLSKLYEHISVMITTDLSFGEWDLVFGDAKMTTDLPDRFAITATSRTRVGWQRYLEVQELDGRNGTRLVCNPRRYSRGRNGGFENPQFDACKFVEVQS